jgi:putative hemolysin
LNDLLLYVVALIVLILFSAFFSGSEAALFSLTRSQVNKLKSRSPGGREIERQLSSPREILTTILIGNLIVNVIATSAATSVAVDLFGDKGVGIAFGFMSVLIIIFGEISPKVLAIDQPERFSLFSIYPLRFLHLIFSPVRRPIAWLTDGVVEFLKQRIGHARRYFSKDELITAFDIGRREQNIGEFQYELLSNIVEFRDTIVKEIMTPSIDVFSLPIDMEPEQMEGKIIEHDVSRVPVYGDTPDDIRGVVHIKDLVSASPYGIDFDIGSILRPPYYVPESTRIPSLFTELGRRKSHLALAIDEHGSFAGIVTMEDILEEIVGEIRDANEPRREEYTLLDDGRIIVSAMMEIDDFNTVFQAAIKDAEHETIGGFVMGATGKIPHEGETFDVGSLRFHIISAQPNRIRKLRVEKL